MTALIEGAAAVAVAPAPRGQMVTRDVRCETAAGHLGGTWRDFDELCERALTLDEIEAGEYRYGTVDDIDQVERHAREKHADALARLVDAAWTALHTTPERTTR